MKDPNNKTFWKRFARAYGPMMEKDAALYESVCQTIRPALQPQMQVLELACGSGQLSFRLTQSVSGWTATDFCEEMIREAKKRPAPDGLQFAVEDATALSYGDGSFDAVVIANALHIMPHPEKALAEIHRVLKPGGLLFAPTFVRGEGLAFWLREHVLQLGGFHLFHDWTDQELVAFVESGGFAVLESTRAGGKSAPLCCLRAVKEKALV